MVTIIFFACANVVSSRLGNGQRGYLTNINFSRWLCEIDDISRSVPEDDFGSVSKAFRSTPGSLDHGIVVNPWKEIFL